MVLAGCHAPPLAGTRKTRAPARCLTRFPPCPQLVEAQGRAERTVEECERRLLASKLRSEADLDALRAEHASQVQSLAAVHRGELDAGEARRAEAVEAGECARRGQVAEMEKKHAGEVGRLRGEADEMEGNLRAQMVVLKVRMD